MAWADFHIEKLAKGETVTFRPRGNSMTGKIESGQLCTVAPVDPKTLAKGDVVLCRVAGKHYLHNVSAVKEDRFQISNNHGFVNGWISAEAVFGKLMKVEA